jgi:hypothetical protein
MSTQDVLAKFFDTLSMDQIAQFADTNEPESEMLDFKIVGEDGKLSQHLRDGYSKCLSAFANAGGGLVIFGVQTGKKPGVAGDVAILHRPFPNVQQFRAELESLPSRSTVPPVQNVRVRTIETGDGMEYVTAYIPQSDAPPHRAIATNHYHRRSGADNRIMAHGELEDMFGRRPPPKLELHISEPVYFSGIYFSHEIPSHPARVDLSMTNVGNGVARFAALQLFLSEDDTVRVLTEGNGGLMAWTRRPRRYGDRTAPYVFAADSHTVVYPQERVDLLSLIFQTRPPDHTPPSPKSTYRLLSDGTLPVAGEHAFDSAATYERLIRERFPHKYPRST